MKMNDSKHSTPSFRSPAEWDKLIDRYYEGMTTSQEEQELITFLFSEEAADPRYEEHRAVLSYTAMGRKYAGSNTASHTTAPAHAAVKLSRRWIAAAAVATILLATGISLYLNHSRNEIYVAYVYGKKYTSPEIVSKQMYESIDNVSVQETDVEKELGNMFNGLPQEPTYD